MSSAALGGSVTPATCRDPDAAFHRLCRAAMAFDQRLRRGISDDEAAALEDLLRRLESNVADRDGSPGPADS
jgi:hypothetical protein